MSEFSFNLADKPWIPCADDSGIRPLGIRDLLVRAHELREIRHQNPLTVAALLRVLLAAVHRIVGGPCDHKEWIALYKSGLFSQEKIDAYFDRWRPKFDLFGDEAPFYQTPGLGMVDQDNNPKEPVSISLMMVERASGNNKTLFDHTTDDTSVYLTPAEAAQVVVTAQMFSLGGLYKKSTNLFGYHERWENAAMVDGILIALTGSSLFETLMLNLLIYKDNQPIPNTSEDCPVWERNDRGSAISKRDKAIPPKGYLDYLTCKCRHLLLVPQQKDGDVVVGQVHAAPGEIFINFPHPSFMSKTGKKGTWHPPLEVDRLLWRDSTALFAFDTAKDNRPMAFRQVSNIRKGIVSRPSRYVCMSIALANKDANPLAWRKESLMVPVALLEDEETTPLLIVGMELAEKVETILRTSVEAFLKAYMQSAYPNKPLEVKKKIESTGAMRVFWDRLERHFHGFLAEIEQGDESLYSWYENIASTARESLESCVKQRYANSARTLKAWAVAADTLNTKLAGLKIK